MENILCCNEYLECRVFRNEAITIELRYLGYCPKCSTCIVELFEYKNKNWTKDRFSGNTALKIFEKYKKQLKEIKSEPKEPQNKFPTWVYFDGKKSEKNVYDWKTDRKVGECLQPLNQS
jgi:hypothetical protein